MCPHLSMVVDSSQGQGGPGELQSLEVESWASSSLAFDGRLFSRSLTGGRGPIKDPHGVKGQTVEDLNTAVVKGQSQT